MATLRDIRNRIKSVKNTSQITRAMKMVSAAKLRRAQERALANRPYAQAVTALTRRLAALATGAHPLFASRPEQNVDLLLCTSDKGLCGSFNANLLRAALNFRDDHPDWRVTIIPIGRKGREFFYRLRAPLGPEFVDVSRGIGLPLAQRIGAVALDRLTKGEADATYVIYSRFISVMNQKPTLQRIFPVPPAEEADLPDVPYLYEPDRARLVERLVPVYADMAVFQAIAETNASEHGARMTAMETATKNAGGLIARLTLFYNRTRQAAITKELIEVVSGADALEG